MTAWFTSGSRPAVAPRSPRPSEVSSSFQSRGIRVEIDEGRLRVVARKDFGIALTRILKSIAREAKVLTSKGDNHPYSKTGNLSRSIGVGPIRAVNQYAVRGSVEAGGPLAPYAKFVHEGTGAHIIRPRPENPTQLLRFLWVKRGPAPIAERFKGDRKVSKLTRPVLSPTSESRGQADRTVYAREVHHPGGKPKPFLVVAARRVVGDVDVRRR